MTQKAQSVTATDHVENHALNVIRTLAAVIVLVEHVRRYNFVGRDDLANPGVGTEALYAMTALGHGAVIVFFVLSGYFVGGSVISSELRGRFRWRNYAVSRLVRLWIVMVPAIALSLVCTWIGASLFPESRLYGPGGAAVDSAQWNEVLGNLFFVQMILVPPVGANGPLWSLAYEAVYYLLFPLILVGVVRRRGLVRIFSAVAAVAVAIFVGPDILMLFPLWLLGAAVAWKSEPIRAWIERQPLRRLLCLRLFLVAGTLGSTVLDTALGGSPQNHPPSTVLVGVFTAALIASLITDVHPRNPLLRGALHGTSRYAHSSFTLYALHAPPLLLLATALSPVGQGQDVEPRPAAWLALIGVAAATMLFAWMAAHLTEHNTDRLRRAVMRSLPRSTSSR